MAASFRTRLRRRERLFGTFVIEFTSPGMGHIVKAAGADYVFLDMEQMIGDTKCHVDTLGDQALWDAAPIEPKTPPNPLKNDKAFLSEFPYLAEPW